ncbi:hypothetical protein ABT336_15515 [Micromonospora sp. NPDC000207]|uniref:hypothetical protein n=1 Tax=Micromonospora sp. NPDC000207 TaxID=3154246 RepID=UPI003324AB02
MRQRLVIGATALTAVALGVTYLALPLMGSDLSAQVARTGFFAEHGPTPVDLRWYGGVHQFGYSLVSQPVMTLLGVRVTGVVAMVASAIVFALLLLRTGVPRPLLGSLVGVVTIAGNLASGRVTYGLGVMFGITALLALTMRRRTPSLAGAAVAAGLASATSPVAGLFVGLVGAALVLTRRPAAGLALGVPAAVPMVVTALLFSDGGWMNISRTDTVHAMVTCLLVAALVAYRPVRVGALLAAAGVLVAALVHTPVGLNAVRLPVMFGLPLLAAAARLPGPLRVRLPRPVRGRPVGVAALCVLLGVTCWWQPPVVTADLRSMGEPTSDRSYFAPLLNELRQRELTGRVEIPPTQNYWEAAYLEDTPLARGWLRQADIARNPLFFTTVPGAPGTGVELTADSYRSWLDENAVQYVAVPDAELSWVGRAEARLVTGGLAYLNLVWTSPHWRLYAVEDARPLVEQPAVVVEHTPTAITVRLPSAQTVLVRVRHSRWLTTEPQARLSESEGWTLLTTTDPGTYTISSTR